MDVSGDNLPLLGDWPPDTPRTKAFLSIILGESDVAIAESGSLSLPKPGFRSGLADRMAARGGFCAPKLDACELRSTNLDSSLELKPYQIPLSPGFSPSAFLDSPLFIFNSLTQPSPTTGKFLLGQDDGSGCLSVPGRDLSSPDVDARPFAFQPCGESDLYCSSAGREVDSDDLRQHQELSNQTGSVDLTPENQQDNHPFSGFTEPTGMNESSVDFKFYNKSSATTTTGNENPSQPPVEQLDGKGQIEEFCSASEGQQSEDDGYNWRKYGQKLVKGSEFPRSYYKCTHLNCPVKKIVKRGINDHTEIIYKGTHSHSMSTLSHRTSGSSSHSFGDTNMDGHDSQGRQAGTMEGRPMWISNADRRNNNVDATSVCMTVEFNDPSDESYLRPESSCDGLHASSILGDREEDVARHCENEESEMKRRKLESSMIDMSAASRAVREPRVVVQTTSEVDILDDGYRWRKYGQKVVKGNPNPRSYYKCTSVGCTVRKHVERASHDLKSVITTYEGKHNHDVPAVKNSNHSTSVSSGTTEILPQSQSIQRKQNHSYAQENFTKFNVPASIGNFSMMSAREQLLPPAGLSFGLSHPCLTSLEMAGLIPGDPMNVLTPFHSFVSESPVLRSMVRKIESVEEQMLESSFPGSNGGSVYQQMMGGLPQM